MANPEVAIPDGTCSDRRCLQYPSFLALVSQSAKDRQGDFESFAPWHIYRYVYSVSNRRPIEHAYITHKKQTREFSKAFMQCSQATIDRYHLPPKQTSQSSAPAFLFAFFFLLRFGFYLLLALGLLFGIFFLS